MCFVTWRFVTVMLLIFLAPSTALGKQLVIGMPHFHCHIALAFPCMTNTKTVLRPSKHIKQLSELHHQRYLLLEQDAVVLMLHNCG